MNHLAKENCNKEMCKSCIFRTDGKEFKLSVERMDEIKAYLVRGESTHICHNTEKTCYGALDYQAKIFNRLQILEQPTVECLLDKAESWIEPHRVDN